MAKKSEKRVAQAPAEILEHFEEQLRFLEKSAADFDAGDRSESKRMALTLRVLLHDAGRSRSLITQLGLNDRLFYDTCEEYDPRNLVSFDGSLVTRVSTEGSYYFAPLDAVPFRSLKPFSRWWRKAYFVDTAKAEFSRRDLVLAVANQDGGGHVDPEVEEAYWRLSRSNSMGWVQSTGGREVPMESPVPPAIRQISHEVLATLHGRVPPATPVGDIHFPRPPGPAPRPVAMGPAKTPGRNDPCPCGSGEKYKKCHGRTAGVSRLTRNCC